MDPDNEAAGYIEYRSNTSMDNCSGLFVTTYYFRDSDCADCNAYKGQDSPWVKTDVYKIGILHYLRVTEQPEFQGWKLVIYIDQLSIENPIFIKDTTSPRAIKHKQEWDEISKHPNVVFGVVFWPEYAVGSKDDGKTIDNAILRALRMKTMSDFPKVPVFVRDADTLFENLIKGGSLSTLADFTQKLTLWEKTLWDNLITLFADPNPYRILIASQPNYHRQWHVEPQTGINTTGCYAAITSSLGNIPEMEDQSYWRKCLSYLRQTMNVTKVGSDRTPNNSQKPTYIGKDEQLLSYVMLPLILDKVYFYYCEYIWVEGGPVEVSPDTPFAQILLDQGIKQYPSPYKISLGESMDNPTTEKRKDENQKTEMTLLNPAIIPMSLDAKTHGIMKTIFKYYLDEIAKAKVVPNFIDKQLGGRRTYKKSSRKSYRNKKRKQRRTYKQAYKHAYIRK